MNENVDIEKGLITVNGEKLIKIHGFRFGDEILLSDCDSIGDHEKVIVKVTPSMIKFWLEDNIQAVERLTGWSIIE